MQKGHKKMDNYKFNLYNHLVLQYQSICKSNSHSAISCMQYHMSAYL